MAQRAGVPAAKQHSDAAKFIASSLLAERGARMAAIRQNLGHKSIAGSAVYAEMSPAQAAAVARQAWMATF